MSGCYTENEQVSSNTRLNFERILKLAQMSQAVYGGAAGEPLTKVLKNQYHFYEGLAPQTDVRFFVLTDETSKEQYIVLRGTANKQDVLDDVEYLKTKERALDLYIHSGFAKALDEVYPLILPQLRLDYSIIITGHSLGGALALLEAMELKLAGFKITSVVTFGQPKVTNASDARKYDNLPLLRVVDRKDPVPLVPPLTLLAAIHGKYVHFGAELLLLSGDHYAVLPAQGVSSYWDTSFWYHLGDEKISDHFMANYIKALTDKLNQSEEVPYADWKKYL